MFAGKISFVSSFALFFASSLVELSISIADRVDDEPARYEF